MLGFETSDDAAVYRLNDDQAAVLTVDFFTPIVDDPYDFGQVTAANSLSDIYAMGATPLVALNLLAFPCKLGPDIIGAVMQGGNDKVREAGAFVVGGHTIEDAEPKFGLCVLGMVHPDKVVRNQGACVDDVIYLTKPIGTGIMTTALKRELITDEDLVPVVRSMAELNRAASEAMVEVGVSAGTDVTGFGLLGHLHEMCESSGVSAQIEFADVPLFEGVYEFAKQQVKPGKTRDMVAWAREFSSVEPVDEKNQFEQEQLNTLYDILCDPQTSGGLLVAVPPHKAARFEELVAQKLGRKASRLGKFTKGNPGHVTIKA